MKKLLELENKYKDKTAVFFGSGPSLLNYNLEKLDPSFVKIGFNFFFPYFVDLWPSLKLDYHIINDPVILQAPMKEYDKFIRHHRGPKIRELNPNAPPNSQYHSDVNLEFYSKTNGDIFLSDESFKEVSLIFSDNVYSNTCKELGFKQNSEWISENKDALSSKNFFTYSTDDESCKNAGGSRIFHPATTLQTTNDNVLVSTAACNSFCAAGLPILLFMGFSKIYLFGVDFSDGGSFYNPTKGGSVYKEKELPQALELLSYAKSLGFTEIYFIGSDKFPTTNDMDHLKIVNGP
jgi:hypothetical protein